jgi:hypothetical protein
MTEIASANSISTTINTPVEPAPITPVTGNPQSTPERERLWQNVEALFTRHFHKPDIEAAKIVLSSAAAHRIAEYPPAWNMAIAVAGSMKTVILEALDGLPDVYLIDEGPPQTFISGMIDSEGHQRKAPASLLHRIGRQGIVVAADFSTILTSDSRNRAKVFSQLRRIYDGHFHREFGSDENLDERDWKGRLTFLAGVTPEVDRHHKIFAALGDRFIRTRWPRAGGTNAAMMAMRQDRQVAVDVKAAIQAFVGPVFSRPVVAAPNFPEPLRRRLASLGEFIALARAYVPRDRKDNIDGEAQIESNTRLPQELAQVGRGWAALMGRAEVTEEDFTLIRRAALDSLPPLRRHIVESAMKGISPHSDGLPVSTVSRANDDLEACGVLRMRKRGEKNAEGSYVLTDNAKALLSAAGEQMK